MDFCVRFVCPKRAPTSLVGLLWNFFPIKVKKNTPPSHRYVGRVVKRFKESIAIRERERKNTEKVQGGRSYLALDFNRHSGFD